MHWFCYKPPISHHPASLNLFPYYQIHVVAWWFLMWLNLNFMLSLSFVNINHFPDLLSHTKGHISYYVTGKEDEQPAVFTGDTLVSWLISLTFFIYGVLMKHIQKIRVLRKEYNKLILKKLHQVLGVSVYDLPFSRFLCECLWVYELCRGPTV